MFKHWRDDALASIVVFLVALPLCMGVAIASGVPQEKAAAVGIMSGFVGGVVVGMVGGCRLQVSGPAAGLVVLVGQLIAQFGLARTGLMVTAAGALQMLAGVLRFGQWFRAVSPAIIQGMLAGIGMLIFASQFHVMVDDAAPGSGKEHGGIINLSTIPVAVWKAFTEPAHQAAAGIGVLTILSIIGWSRFSPRSMRLVPAPLFGVVVAALANVVAESWGFDPKNVDVPTSLLSAIEFPPLSELHHVLDQTMIIHVITLAFVASAESLLTASAVDTMQQHAPRTDYDRELVGQGLGNLLCGALGGLPVTGVIVRSAANVQAGGRTRLSTVLHGLWMLLFALLVPQVLRMVPVAGLAAILVFTGCKLMYPKALRELSQFGKGEVAVYLVTFIGVVVIDLLAGIVLGLGVATSLLLHRFSRLEIETDEVVGQKRLTIRLRGAATFLRLPKLAAVLQAIPPGTETHFQVDGLQHLDHACFELLFNWQRQHEATGGVVVLDWNRLPIRRRRLETPHLVA